MESRFYLWLINPNLPPEIAGLFKGLLNLGFPWPLLNHCFWGGALGGVGWPVNKKIGGNEFWRPCKTRRNPTHTLWWFGQFETSKDLSFWAIYIYIYIYILYVYIYTCIIYTCILQRPSCTRQLLELEIQLWAVQLFIRPRRGFQRGCCSSRSNHLN